MALDFFAGCLGGCAGVIVGHPLDTVKVHLQTQDMRNPQYRGTMDCIRKICAKEGARGLYRGMSSPLSGVAAINAVVFGVFGNAQRRFAEPEALRTHVLAGSVTGLSQSVLVAPMELIKLRAQVSNISPMDCINKICATEGVIGLFRGLGITAVREVPAFALYFGTFKYLTENDNVSTGRMLMAGGLAGVASWVFTYPVDVLKSRVQFDGMSGNSQYSCTFDCLRKSIAREGYGFLYRGLTPTLVRAFPVNAATFTVVTWTMRLANEDVRIEFNLDGLVKMFQPNVLLA